MNRQTSLTLIAASLLILAGCGGNVKEEEFGSKGSAGKTKKTETAAAVVKGPAATTEGIGPQALGETAYPEGVAEVKGKVTLIPKYKPMDLIDMTSNESCHKLHPDAAIKYETVITDDNKDLKNAVIYVSKGLEKYRFDPPAEAAEVNQKGCQYIPHVFALMAGQKLAIRNSDETLHNVNAVGHFNLSMPKPDVVQRQFDEASLVHFKCDAHAWMSSKCAVFDHPFFAISKDDGTFELPKKLAPGKYTLSAWHEDDRFAAKSVDIEVKDDGSVTPAEISFAFDKK